MRRIAVVTTSRADYGIYRPLLNRLKQDPAVELSLIAGGMHLSADYGHTVDEIAGDGFEIAACVDLLSGDDTPAGIARSMGNGVLGFAEAFDTLAPDIVVVLGDRFEMHAAAVAAQPFAMALAHIHGGELTAGAMDDSLRHSLTKLSHLHFPATETYARRIRQLGEEPWRITVAGALGLDNVAEVARAPRGELEQRLGLSLEIPPLLVTFHPATREEIDRFGDMESQANALFRALEAAGLPVVFTAPNADEGGRRLRAMTEAFVQAHDTARFVESLGTRGYFGLMEHAAAMVGNSSSGILEAAAFKLPVVNIGSRQQGRARNANVIDVDPDTDAIAAAIQRARSAPFRATLAAMTDIYRADRPAAETIHARLATAPLGGGLLKKVFVDMTEEGTG